LKQQLAALNQEKGTLKDSVQDLRQLLNKVNYEGEYRSETYRARNVRFTLNSRLISRQPSEDFKQAST
jgi:hypothetical protein